MFDKKPKGEYVRKMSVSLQVCHSFMTNLMISGQTGAPEMFGVMSTPHRFEPEAGHYNEAT